MREPILRLLDAEQATDAECIALDTRTGRGPRQVLLFCQPAFTEFGQVFTEIFSCYGPSLPGSVESIFADVLAFDNMTALVRG